MDDTKTPPPPLTIEEKQDKAKLFKAIPFLIVGSIACIAVSAGLTLSGTINLAGRTTSLPTFGDRLEFTFKYQTLPALWLLVLICLVIVQRNKTGALNPLGEREIFLRKQANILQNSFEQFILSAFAQFILVAFINEEWTLRTIPCVNFLLFFGRVTFFLGYPTYRTFGLFLGFIPTAAMFGVATYKFLEHLFF